MIRSRWIPLLTAVLNQGWFCPQKTFGKVWRQFMVVTTWMGKMKCYKPLNGHKARDAAKHVTAPNNKELSSPKCQHCWGWTSLVYKSTFQGSDPKVSVWSLKATIVLVGKVLLEKPNQLAKEFWDDLHITRRSTPKSDWLYSLQPKMEKLYTVSKNKTRSWLWLRPWTPYCQIQT